MIPTRGRGILDVPGLALGHAGTLTRDRLTGVSVVIPPTGSTIGVDVRGGGPATHETDVVSPTAHGYGADAIVLTGGSALGLRSVSGVCDALAEVGRGFPAPGLDDAVVPLVPAAAIYDLGRGSGEVAPPTIAEGAEAARAALTGVGTGDQGAGTAGRAGTASDQGVSTDVRGSIGVGLGARAGMQTLRSSLGSVSVPVPGGYTVAALVVANPFGTIGTGQGDLWGGALLAEVGWDLPPLPALPAPDPLAAASARNTTLAIVATDARLDTAQVSCLAFGGHPGIARAVRPSHTLFDGDTVFAIATGEVPLPEDRGQAAADLVALTAAAADAITLAILDAVVSAAPLEASWGQPPTLSDIAPEFVAAFSALP
ncbi:P1 family peptidase [Brevibacterium casei]|uniref:P1 family peptidase n=1 Tax=Brevibacterium casei TaxID=33889 RepID=UPI0009284190|nr:P1 family peptidase [Brevibacterium casei]SII44444.1 peptidase S58, DmpA [Mycobacteroides abscessus subsp. abscessus]